jgi:hypothetical protein
MGSAGARDVEELLGALGEALGRACSRDPKLRSLLTELRRAGLEVRLTLRPRPARPGSPGFAVQLQHPWSRGWSPEDVETLHALGIALGENELSSPEPDGRSSR